MRSLGLALVLLGCAAPRTPALPKRWSAPWGTEQVTCSSGSDQPERARAMHACRSGSAEACVVALDHLHLSEADALRARSELEANCVASPVCGCERYGYALLLDKQGRFDREALEVLRLACTRGAVSACDLLVMETDLCKLQDQKPICAALVAEGRLAPKPPPRVVGPVELPARFLGCFVVAKDELARLGNAPVGPNLCLIDPIACPRAAGASVDLELHAPERALGATYCFEEDRVSYVAPKGDWNQLLTVWLADVDRPTSFTSSQGLRVEEEGGGVVLREASGVLRLARASNNVTKPPRLEQVCAHARRCAARIEAMLPKADEPGDAPPSPEPSGDLEGCRGLERAARAKVKVAPPDCD